MHTAPTTTLLMHLRSDEAQALAELDAELNLSQEQVLRQALRLYQTDALKRREGFQAVYIDSDGKPEAPRFSMLAPL